jgi:cell pole-organizing protein PopZ
MEEILASIRQIISEDSEPATVQEPEAKQPFHMESRSNGRSPPSRSDAASISPNKAEHKFPALRIESERPQNLNAIPRSAPEQRGQLEARSRPETSLPAEPASSSLAPSPERRRDDGPLLSSNSDSAVAGSFSALAHTILAQNARTLEDLVSEMLRPMLKDWLDENLPMLVERLVQEEIQRVARGRR